MSVVQPDRVAAERVELRQVPAGLARVLADPEADDPDSQSWAHGYPLPGTRVAARNFVRRPRPTAMAATVSGACSRSRHLRLHRPANLGKRAGGAGWGNPGKNFPRIYRPVNADAAAFFRQTRGRRACL